MYALGLFYYPTEMEQAHDPNVLKTLFEQPDAYKFIIGMFVLFIVPQIINIINTIIKNKNVKEFNESIVDKVNFIGKDVQLMKDRVNQMYIDNFDECTNQQIEHAFRGRVSIDIELLVKNTKQVVIINHIENHDATKLKIVNYCNTVFANTKLIMNQYHRNGIPCGAFINNANWTPIIVDTIMAFLYSNQDEDIAKSQYSYEALKFHLKSQYDTLTVEFINRVNEENII